MLCHLLAVVLTTVCPASLAQHDVTGWYTVPDGTYRLLTYAAGGGYRFVDFEKRYFDTIEQASNQTFTWKVGKDLRLLTLTGNELTWTDSSGGVQHLKPLEDAPYRVEEITFQNGATRLVGTLMLPNTASKSPAVTIIHGSGTSHRNNLWYQVQADYLAKHGIAVLLPDKRGCGSSGGDWKTADFRALAYDAIAAVNALASRKEVDAQRIGALGLSQGGWIAPLAATLSQKISFVLDVSGAAVKPDEQLMHEMKNTFREAGLKGKDFDDALRLQELAGNYLATNQWKPYGEARSKGLQSPWSEIAKDYPSTQQDWSWAWWRSILNFDPVATMKSLKVPCLVVYGAEDEHDNVPVAESLRRLKELTNVDVKVFPGLGHALADPKTQQVSPEYLDFITNWIHSRRRT